MSVSDYLMKVFAAVPPESRILDLAGPSSERPLSLHALGFDLSVCLPSTQAVDKLCAAMSNVQAQTKPPFICAGDVSQLPFSCSVFDWVILDGRLDGASLDSQLSECTRVLKEGGWVYLVVDSDAPRQPTHESWRELMDAHYLAIARDPIERKDGTHLIYRLVSRD